MSQDKLALVFLFAHDPNYPREAFGMVVSQESLSGPLPSPKLVAGYNEVIANGGERIMVMAEKE